jgi:surface antigen
MKKLIAGMTIIIASTSFIAGCSTNAQKENTGVGAVSGAVIGGVGAAALHANPVAIGVTAVAGAIIGGVIGNHMDSTDTNGVYTTMDKNATNMPSHWTNPKTGVTYRIVPTSDMMTVGDNPNCRSYRATAVMNGKKHSNYGVMCRQANGTWMVTKS